MPTRNDDVAFILVTVPVYTGIVLVHTGIVMHVHWYRAYVHWCRAYVHWYDKATGTKSRLLHVKL